MITTDWEIHDKKSLRQTRHWANDDKSSSKIRLDGCKMVEIKEMVQEKGATGFFVLAK